VPPVVVSLDSIEGTRSKSAGNATASRATIPKGVSMSETTQSGLSDNAVAAISYITFVPAIVFLILPPYNTSSFVRFHAWQSIFLNITAFVVSVAIGIVLGMTVFFAPFAFLLLSRLVWLCWVLVWILCLINALNGKRFKLPVIGALAEKQAGA
jgi:uncharacterized membrane protein